MKREKALSAEEALLAHALRGRAIGDALPFLVAELDATGQLVYANPAHRELVGRPPEALLGTKWLDSLHPDDVDTAKAALAQSASGGSVGVTLRVLRKGDGWRWLEGNLVSFQAPASETHTVVVGRDVTEIRAHQDRFRLIGEASTDLVAEIDERGVLAFVSGSHENVLGHRPEKLVGTSLIDLLHPDDVPEIAQALGRIGIDERMRTRFRMRHGSGGWRWIDCTATVYRNAEGEQRVVGVSRDVTEGVALEEALREAQQRAQQLATRREDRREAERVRVAREIHDELGQGLTSLRLQLDAWSDAPGVDLDQRVALLAEIDHLIEAVRRIGARMLPPALEEFGLVAAIESQARSLADAAGWKLQTELALDETGLDSRQEAAVFRVAQEALTNVARHAGALQVEVRMQVSDQGLRLTVSDDGRGISPESASSPRSSGLSGMRARAEALGATLRIAGEPAGGSVVTLRVPPNTASGPPPPKLDQE